MSAYDPTHDSPDLTEAWLRYKNLPIRHHGGLHGIFKSGWDAARIQSAPVQVSREQLAQLLNSHQLWGRLVDDPDDWEDYASEDVRAAHLKTADAILTLLGRETVQGFAITTDALKLDPEPMRSPYTTKNEHWHAYDSKMCPRLPACIFLPRPGYSQNEEDY